MAPPKFKNKDPDAMDFLDCESDSGPAPTRKRRALKIDSPTDKISNADLKSKFLLLELAHKKLECTIKELQIVIDVQQTELDNQRVELDLLKKGKELPQ
uniref:Uncharacterized protein n=1 Tax=Caenorhabditis japonica TaxID=281687 RepID=A0A8R1IPX5_CAEJA